MLVLILVSRIVSQCEYKAAAQEIFLIIGLALQLKNEDKSPFTHLVLCVDFNSVDIKESNTHIMISCENYIDCMLCAHFLDMPKSKPAKNSSPLPDTCLKIIFLECGPDEGIVYACKLEVSQCFGYYTLLGKMMYTYVDYLLDIDYVITTMSKFLTKPSERTYELLKQITKYLMCNNTLRYQVLLFYYQDLKPVTLVSDVVLDENLPLFPVDIDQPKLMAFVNGTYANDQHKCRSTTGR